MCEHPFRSALMSMPAVAAPRGLCAPASELVTAFLSGRSERTRQAYAQDLDDFTVFVGTASVNLAAQQLLGNGQGAANALVLAYRAALVERGLAPATVNRRLAALRSLVGLARTLGLAGWTLEVRSVKAERYRDTRGPGISGVRRLLAVL